MQVRAINRSISIKILAPMHRKPVKDENMMVAVPDMSTYVGRQVTITTMFKHKAMSFEESRLPINKTIGLKGDAPVQYLTNINGHVKSDWKGVPEKDVRLTALSRDTLMFVIDHDLREGVVPENPSNGKLDVALLEYALILHHFTYFADAVITDAEELGRDAEFRKLPIAKCRNCPCFQGGLSIELDEKINYAEIEVGTGMVSPHDTTACEGCKQQSRWQRIIYPAGHCATCGLMMKRRNQFGNSYCCEECRAAKGHNVTHSRECNLRHAKNVVENLQQGKPLKIEINPTTEVPKITKAIHLLKRTLLMRTNGLAAQGATFENESSWAADFATLEEPRDMISNKLDRAIASNEDAGYMPEFMGTEDKDLNETTAQSYLALMTTVLNTFRNMEHKELTGLENHFKYEKSTEDAFI